MELRLILEIVWRRKWIILPTFLLIFSIAVGLSLIKPKVYESSVTFSMKDSEAASSFLSGIGLNEATSLMKTGSTSAESHMALVTAEPILRKVITTLQLRDNNGNLFSPDDITTYKLLSQSLFPKPFIEVIQSDTSADIFQITVQADSPECAATIANTLAAMYIDGNLMQRREEYHSVRRFINKQIELVKADYLDVLERIRDFKGDRDVLDIDVEVQSATARIASLMTEKEGVVGEISQARAKLFTLQQQLEVMGGAYLPASMLTASPQIESLKKTISDLELELAAQMVEKKAGHPDVVAMDKRIELAKAELAHEVAAYKATSKDVEDLEQEISGLEAKLKVLDASIEDARKHAATFSEKSFALSQLEFQHNLAQDRYGTILDYLYLVGIAEAMTLSDIRLVAEAMPPHTSEPESPSKKIHAVLGMFLGLVFGLFVGFLVDYLDDSVKDQDEVAEYGLMVLGNVPRIRKKSEIVQTSRDPKDPISEAYRTIRNGIKFASLDASLSCFAVTSSIQGEGKTVTAANLAVAVVQEGKTAVVLDADLRNPRVHDAFGRRNGVGVTSYLTGETSLASVITRTDLPGLDIVTSGPLPPNPGALIESQRLRDMISELREKYDVVFVDCPPILVADDALVAGSFTDMLLFVVESGRISRDIFHNVTETLNKANIARKGVIVNKVKTSRRHYYYYYGYGG